MTVQVPIKSLRLPGVYPGVPTANGEESKDVTPEKGDPVSFSVEGVVQSVTGGMADVNVRLINGERPDAAGGEAEKKKPAQSEEMTPEDMQQAAQDADEEAYT